MYNPKSMNKMEKLISKKASLNLLHSKVHGSTSFKLTNKDRFSPLLFMITMAPKAKNNNNYKQIQMKRDIVIRPLYSFTCKSCFFCDLSNMIPNLSTNSITMKCLKTMDYISP